MAIEERISEELKLIDLKKKSLRDVILMQAMKWKDLEEQLDSTETCVEGCLSELQFREKNLDSIQESVRESKEELDSLRKSIQSRLEELEMRESNFLSFQQMHVAELTLKQKQLDTMRNSAEERIKEAELREERLTEQHKSLERLLEKLKLEKEDLEHIQKSIDQRSEEIILKESYFEGRSTELDSIQNWIERRAKELDTKQERVDDRISELELEEGLMRKLNEERCKDFELKVREIDCAQKLSDERSEKLDSKERQLDAVQKYINQSFKDFHSKNKQLKLEKQLVLERSKELESKAEQLEERCKEVELIQMQFDRSAHSPVRAEILFVVRMDGRTLQLFLNEQSLDDKLIPSEVHRALQLSVDPAKLVLDAMEGFYPPHLKKGNVEFGEDVVRRSCIVLLQELMNISPPIKPHVKEEALKLSGQWKAKMRSVPCDYLEVLGFLQLLASYKLASGFDTDELLKLFVVVAEHNQAPELCRVLGFTDKLPALIENFVKEKQELVAVRVSFGFGLFDKFPPVPLLKSYLNRAKKVSEKQIIKGEKSSEAQDKVIDERVASIKVVIKCIVDHNLESQFSCKRLEQDIKQLLIQKESTKQIIARLIKTRTKEDDASRVRSSISAPVQPKASSSKLNPTIHPMACILANMDGKNLQLFLNENLEEYEGIHNEVYNALLTLSDSGNLVLDAMQGFYPPHSTKGGIDIEASVIRRSCIFLLEILMRLSQQIKPHVKAAALKLAFDWKEKSVIDIKNSVAILGFLLLVGTYGLAPAFDRDELHNLFQTVAKHRLGPQLSQALGFSEKVLVNNILHFREKIDRSASENLQLNSIVHSSSAGPSHSMWGGGPAWIQFASDPAKLVLDSMLGCYHSNFKENTIKALSLLLSQLLRVAPEVKTHVKEQAMKLASDWKDKVKQRSPSEVWCFLLFLATYKVASCFHVSELLDLSEVVCNRRQATDLFGALGLADEASDFIRRLIRKAVYLDAIKYIYAFGLVDKFPPSSLLQRYFRHAKEAAKNIRKEGRKSHNFLRSQNKAIKKEAAALNMVIKCIELHGLKSQSQYSPVNRNARIGQLSRQQRSVLPAPAAKGQPPKEVDNSNAMQSLASMAHLQEQDGRKRLAPVLDHDSNTQHHSAKKICREVMSAGAMTNSPVHADHPLPSMQQPYRHPPGVFVPETATYPSTQSAHYFRGASTPVPAVHMSHLPSGYGSGTPVSGGFQPFGLASTQFSSVPNWNARPYTVAGRHYSFSSQSGWS